jgi:uncharacterized protein (DUF427 family)
MVSVQPIVPRAGQESVWDYLRPPRIEPTSRRIVVKIAGITLADTTKAYRVLETSHPPVYYLPTADIRMQYLTPTLQQSFCEFKGYANYWTVTVGERVEVNAGWSYENPSTGYESIQGHIAFYAGRTDECLVDGELVTPQPGGFYGGWITSDVVGPFKGGPDSRGW